jgi:hypothetical protein
MRTDCDKIYYQRVEEESELISLSSNKLLENGYVAYFDPLKMVGISCTWRMTEITFERVW